MLYPGSGFFLIPSTIKPWGHQNYLSAPSAVIGVWGVCLWPCGNPSIGMVYVQNVPRQDLNYSSQCCSFARHNMISCYNNDSRSDILLTRGHLFAICNGYLSQHTKRSLHTSSFFLFYTQRKIVLEVILLHILRFQVLETKI